MLGNKRRPSNDTFESDDLTYQSSNKKMIWVCFDLSLKKDFINPYGHL